MNILNIPYWLLTHKSSLTACPPWDGIISVLYEDHFSLRKQLSSYTGIFYLMEKSFFHLLSLKKKKNPLTHLWGHELALTSSTEFKFPGICLWQKNLRFILHSQLLKLNLCLAGQFVSRSLYNSVIPVWFHGTMYKNKLTHVARLPCQNTIPVPAVMDSAGAAAMLKKCWSVTAICRTLSDTIPFLTLNVQITGHFKCSAAPATT